jgi:hypothetical protein
MISKISPVSFMITPLLTVLKTQEMSIVLSKSRFDTRASRGHVQHLRISKPQPKPPDHPQSTFNIQIWILVAMAMVYILNL